MMAISLSQFINPISLDCYKQDFGIRFALRDLLPRQLIEPVAGGIGKGP